MNVHKGHRGHKSTRALPAMLILALAACGSSPTGATPTANSSTAKPRASATPVTTTDPGDPTLLPVPADIPFAQAPLPAQNEWRPYYATGAITVVPNSTVPFKRPPTPRVGNRAGGTVDDAAAQRWGDALIREVAWENWAISANQLSLLDSGVVSARAVTAGISLPTGATGLTISGSRWPSTLRLVKVSSTAQGFLNITDGYAFVITFAKGWAVNATFPDGHTAPISGQTVPAGGIAAVTGKISQLPEFGELWYGSEGFACDSSEPPQIVALCSE